MRLLVALLLCSLLGFWLFGGGDAPQPAAQPVGQAGSPDAAPLAPAAGQASTPAQQEPRKVEPAAAFEMVDDEGNALPLLARDGLRLRFLRADGQALAGHRVHVHWRKGFGKYGADRGDTDGEGRFASTIPELHMLEWVEVPGYEGQRFSGNGAFDLDGKGEVVVQLPEIVALHLVLRDLDGKPCSGVKARIEPVQTLNPPLVCLLDDEDLEVESDAEGRIQTRVGKGVYKVKLKSDASFIPLHRLRIHANRSQPRYTATCLLHRVGSGRRLMVDLRAPGNLDKAPRVLAGCATPPPSQAPEWVEYRAENTVRRGRPLEPGSYELADFPKTPARVWAVHPSCQRAAAEIDALQLRVQLELSLRKARKQQPDKRISIRGQVFDPAGRPLTMRRVRLLRDDRILWGPSADTDRHGRFEIRAKPGKPGVLMVVDGSGHSMFGPYALDEEPEPVELRLAETKGEIDGRVVDSEGRPVAAMVQVYRRRGRIAQLDQSNPRDFLTHCPQEQMRSSDKQSGRFTLNSLPAGEEVCIIADPWEGSLPKGRVISRVGASGVEVVLGKGFVDDAQVQGKIRDARSKQAIEGVHIRATRTAAGGYSLGELQSDQAGEFHMVGGTPGVYSFYLHRRGYAAIEVEEKRLAIGSNRLDFELWPATVAYLQLVDKQGRPLHGVEVAAYDARSGDLLIFQDEQQRPDPGDFPSSDLNGRVDLRGLPAARVRLVFRGPTGPDEDESKAPTVEHSLDLQQNRPDLRKLVLAL